MVLIIAHETRGQKRQGYIDYDKVIVSFPQNDLEQKKLDSRTKELNDSLKILVREFQEMTRTTVDYPQTKEGDLQIKKRVQELNDKLNKLYTFRDKVESEIKQLKDEKDFKMKQVVTKELQTFSLDNNVICVLDKKSILYCNDCVDFTDDFIKYFKSSRK